MSTSDTTERAGTASRRADTPIIEQSPTVDVGKRTFVILPGLLSAIPARKLRKA